jgi:2'-5' RNA ligase
VPSRCFVAALPDAATVEVLRSLPRPSEHGVRWVPEENWHVTLRFIGDADVESIRGILADTRLPAAVASLGPQVEELGGQIVVPVDGVDALAHAVRAATAPFVDEQQRTFRGHLTIARTRRDATSSLLGTPVAVRFDVHQVALVESDLRPDGAVYTTVATFPTVGGVSPRRD